MRELEKGARSRKLRSGMLWDDLGMNTFDASENTFSVWMLSADKCCASQGGTGMEWGASVLPIADCVVF